MTDAVRSFVERYYQGSPPREIILRLERIDDIIRSGVPTDLPYGVNATDFELNLTQIAALVIEQYERGM